ncbi:ABC transporter permease [Lentzea sp. BCCO 10_0061]|uniref:ABC transporter permease n=1 Tax=Lentzea sokolovensis TaxID=3095429 RepID=A0ABU4V4W5_9PSEU|nr:ABC transporter permease [Lentzea sp. BCCO 10_0061]MDX8146827.1 ABC transporter permease [Lentzea sp. BCCO 10_0061]
MTWIVWRQQRPVFITLVAGLVVAVVAILLLRAVMVADLTAGNLLDCVGKGIDACNSPAANDFQTTWFDRLHLAEVTVLAAPVLIGVFVGAPLFAREFEQGTHALAFTQSVSRTRWMATKFVVAALPALVVVLAYQLVVHSWLDAAGQLGPLSMGPFYFTTFDAHGVSPVAYTLFAYTLGMFAGAVFKRTLVAMTLTLGLFIAVRVVIGGVRESLIAPTRVLSDDLDSRTVVRGPLVVESGFLDAKGAVVADPTPMMNCAGKGDAQGAVDFAACYRENGLAQRYADVIPVDQATTLHLLEASIFAGLGVLFVLGSVWAVRRQV